MQDTLTPEPAARGIHLLVVADSADSFCRLRDLLVQRTDGRVQADHARSPQEALVRIRTAEYDLVLCDSKSSDETSVSWINQLRKDDLQNQVIFLRDPLDDTAIEALIQAAACDCPPGCNGNRACIALPILSTIDLYRKQRRDRNSEEMLRKLRRTVEQSPDLVMITNASGVLEYVNTAFETVTGYSREEVIGQTLGILKSEQQAGELYEEMWNTVLSGNTFRGIVINRKKNGETITIEKAITPLRNVEGQITHFISTGRDITDQRRLESALQQAQKMDAIGRLAGGVAHDFNNLLMVISAYAELMLDSLTAEHPLRQNVGEIITAARRAADLTRQLLAFGRKQMQSLQLLDLNKVIHEINKMLPRLIGEDVQLLFVPAEDLGKVKADPVQIEQVLMNLAANARDAMPRGGKLTIETANLRLDQVYVERHSIVPPGDYVMLALTDSGEGIAPEHLAHIFEPFYTTKEAGKGTGLGLATVYGIVKQSGGFIWVYSEPGLGTTFKVYLPRVQAAEEEIAAAKVAGKPLQGCETLLLVEDEAPIRQPAREFLTRHGYTVLEATDGENALHVSREYCGPIDLLISDVVMPRMSGPRLAEQLAAERPKMKVLFVSGYAEHTVLRHGKIDVTTHFLQKPFSLKMLAGKVREVLDAAEPLASAAASAGPV